MEIEDREYKDRDHAEINADNYGVILATQENEWKITQIKDKLFDTAHSYDKDVLKDSIKALHSMLECTECSLWSINHNSTQSEDKLSSASLICRECAVEYSFSNPTDYVHDLNKGLFTSVIEAIKTDNYVFIFSREEALASGHISKDFVDKANLTRFIEFPIFDKNTNLIVAYLEMSYQKCDLDDSFWESLSMVIRPHFFEALNRYRDVQKRTLVDLLIKCHHEFINVDIGVLFRNIITNVLLKVCPAQSASFYIWDTFYNRYNLVATTGLESDASDLLDVYYQKGKGRIGQIGQTAKPYIIIEDYIKENVESQNTLNHLNNKVKTEVIIPVINPSKEGDVIGICRLVNKKNICNERIIDYFNDGDVSLFMCAAEYLALIVYNYKKEEMQFSYIGSLAHDINTPISSIRKIAYRLFAHLSDKEFVENRLEPYLKNIIDIAESQAQQVSNILYLSSFHRHQPFEMRYRIEPTLLHMVINNSIDAAVRFARTFSIDLKIDSKFDTQLSLKIDKRAFVTVFVNLFKIVFRFYYKSQISIGITHDLWNHEGLLVIDLIVYGIQDFGKQIKSEIENLCKEGADIHEIALLYGVECAVVSQILKDFDCKVLVAHPKAPTVIRIILPKKLIIDYEEL